jgi:hypothetical protein
MGKRNYLHQISDSVKKKKRKKRRRNQALKTMDVGTLRCSFAWVSANKSRIVLADQSFFRRSIRINGLGKKRERNKETKTNKTHERNCMPDSVR